MADQVNDSIEIASKFLNLSIENNCNKENINYNCDNDTEKWGLPMTEVYKLAVSFYKGMFKVRYYLRKIDICLSYFQLINPHPIVIFPY